MFLADGLPGGMITAEIMNWTGHVVVAPRSRLADLIVRPEASRTGIYFLSGVDPETGARSHVYIGESDNVGKRLAQHNKAEDSGGKDFWDHACLVTSKDHNLTKTHARFLESRLITIAKDAGRAALINGTAPDYGFLPEADTADMEFFIEQIRIILPVLGLDFLREKPQPSLSVYQQAAELAVDGTPNRSDKPAAADAPIFEISSRHLGLTAEAVEFGNEFVVLAGSKAKATWIGDRKYNNSYCRLHEALVEDGTLLPDGEVRVFNADTVFTSPSAAAAIVYGRSSNGRTAWRLKGTNKTYAEYQEDLVAAVESPGGEDD